MAALVEGAPAAVGAPTFAVHRTHLTPEGRKITPSEDAKLMLCATRGGAARLARGPRPLVVAEGIETALSPLVAPHIVLPPSSRPPSVWATLSSGDTATLDPPQRPGILVIAADGDPVGRRGVGRHAGPRTRGAGLERPAHGVGRDHRSVTGRHRTGAGSAPDTVAPMVSSRCAPTQTKRPGQRWQGLVRPDPEEASQDVRSTEPLRRRSIQANERGAGRTGLRTASGPGNAPGAAISQWKEIP